MTMESPAMLSGWFADDARVLTGLQPWWWLLFHGKEIENRTWKTGYRGWVWLHASARRSPSEYADAVLMIRERGLGIEMPPLDKLPVGVILGRAYISDCVPPETPDSEIRLRHPGIDTRWHMKPQYGWILERITPLKTPIPHTGGLGLRRLTPELRNRLITTEAA
jgi:hypothetical protein